jgi:hypothetical protein
MLAVVQLLALVLAYWAFRLITKKRLRDLKIRWSLVLFLLGLAPVAYYIFGWLMQQNIIQETYYLQAHGAMMGGALSMIIFSPSLFIAALVLFLQERKSSKT